MIEKMESWLRENRPAFIRDGVTAEFSPALDTDPSSARIDFETPELLGRVTVWANGLCDLEMISVDTGEQIRWEHRDNIGAESVVHVLTEFVGDLLLRRKNRG